MCHVRTNYVVQLASWVEHPQSHPVRALEQWCPDLPKVSAVLKFSARCARDCTVI